MKTQLFGAFGELSVGQHRGATNVFQYFAEKKEENYYKIINEINLEFPGVELTFE